MVPSLAEIIKYGPIVCGLLSVAALFLINLIKKHKHQLSDLVVVGMSGSSIPTGCLLIYGAFDADVLTQLTSADADANLYIAFAGLALLYIFYQTFKEKI